MHQPYQPPKGYESYYTLGELFPGLKGFKPIKDFAHLRRILRTACSLYISQYTKKTPQVVKDYFEAQAKKENQKSQENLENEYSHQTQSGAFGDKIAGSSLRDAMETDANAQESIVQRYGVFKQSLASFMKGFNEGVAGNTDIAGNVLFHQDCARLDNVPCIYLADEDSESVQRLQTRVISYKT